MRRNRLALLEPYEVIGQPVVTATRLVFQPWVEAALAPYSATRLPLGPAPGLRAALLRLQSGPPSPDGVPAAS